MSSGKKRLKEAVVRGHHLWPLGLGFGTIIFGLIMTQEELRTALPAVLTLLPLLLQGTPDLSKAKNNSP